MDETFVLTFVIIAVLLIIYTSQTDMFTNADDPETKWDKQIVKVAEVVNAECPPGYIGKKSATCQTDKNWKVEDTCVPVVCKADGTWSDATATFGNSVTKICDYGFQGMNVQTCQPDGTFKIVEGGCTPITCDLDVQKPVICKVPADNTDAWTRRTAIPGNKIYANCPTGQFGSKEMTCGPKGGSDWTNEISNCRFGPFLPQDMKLKKFKELWSTSGMYKLSIGAKGNMSIRNENDTEIASAVKDDRRADGEYYLLIQADGNMVIREENGYLLWASDTNTAEEKNKKFVGPFKLKMQNDANVVLYDASNQPMWASNTAWPWTQIRWKSPRRSNWCFDTRSTGQAQMWNCGGGGNDFNQFKVDPKTRILNKGSNKCLGVDSTADLARVVEKECDDSDLQKWSVDSNGLIKLVKSERTGAPNGMCIDMGLSQNTNDGSPTVIWPCNSGENQLFAL